MFSTTSSRDVQDSMYPMGEATLAAAPDVAESAFVMPNTHDVPINLKPFGLDHPGTVFLPTDESHSRIEATIGRSY